MFLKGTGSRVHSLDEDRINEPKIKNANSYPTTYIHDGSTPLAVITPKSSTIYSN